MTKSILLIEEIAISKMLTSYKNVGAAWQLFNTISLPENLSCEKRQIAAIAQCSILSLCFNT